MDFLFDFPWISCEAIPKRQKKTKKSHFFLDSNEISCTFAVFYSTNTLQQNTTT